MTGRDSQLPAWACASCDFRTTDRMEAHRHGQTNGHGVVLEPEVSPGCGRCKDMGHNCGFHEPKFAACEWAQIGNDYGPIIHCDLAKGHDGEHHYPESQLPASERPCANCGAKTWSDGSPDGIYAWRFGLDFCNTGCLVLWASRKPEVPESPLADGKCIHGHRRQTDCPRCQFLRGMAYAESRQRSPLPERGHCNLECSPETARLRAERDALRTVVDVVMAEYRAGRLSDPAIIPAAIEFGKGQR